MVNEAISIVMIDEKTLEKLGSFPISREYYRTLIESNRIRYHFCR